MTCRHKTAARALERAAIYSAEQTPQPATISKVLRVGRDSTSDAFMIAQCPPTNCRRHCRYDESTASGLVNLRDISTHAKMVENQPGER
jgi:hypothetical protein